MSTGVSRDDMIMKLENQAQSEATEKAWCDEQLAKTEFKKSELVDDIAKLTSEIDVASARSAALKGEVKELQSEFAALAKLQAEMDQIRSETHAGTPRRSLNWKRAWRVSAARGTRSASTTA